MRALGCAAALLVVGAGGCETFAPNTCDPSEAANPPLVYRGGATRDCVYNSSPPPDGGVFGGAELLYFPGGMHYEIPLGAGCQVTWVQSYLSFQEDGGALGPAAGNQTLLRVETGDGGVPPWDGGGSSILVSNDSCVAYWLLVVAGISPSSCACQ
jgi:hypothetical protein